MKRESNTPAISLNNPKDDSLEELEEVALFIFSLFFEEEMKDNKNYKITQL